MSCRVDGKLEKPLIYDLLGVSWMREGCTQYTNLQALWLHWGFVEIVCYNCFERVGEVTEQTLRLFGL